MPTLTADGRNAACDGLVDTLNTGTIEFQTAGHAEVATCTFGNPAFGAAATGVATAEAITDDSDAAGGTIDHAHLKQSDTTDMASCTCAVGSGDFDLTSLVVGAGDTVTISSLTITQPA